MGKGVIERKINTCIKDFVIFDSVANEGGAKHIKGRELVMFSVL